MYWTYEGIVAILMSKEAMLIREGHVMQAFRTLSFAQEVIFAPGALERIGEAVERFGWQRLLLCTSNSQRIAGHVATVSSLLGERMVASYEHVQSHVPEAQVAEVLALALEHNVDALTCPGRWQSNRHGKGCQSSD